MTLDIIDKNGVVLNMQVDTLRMTMEDDLWTACFFTDITDCVTAQDEDTETVDSLQNEIKFREETEQLREDVGRIMRHDLKNPLNTILGFTDILLMSVTDPAAQQRLCRIKDAGQSMLFMIDHSLDLLKMEFGTYALATDRIDLSDVLVDTAENMEPLCSKSDTTLRLMKGDKVLARGGKYHVLGETVYLQKLFANLIKNAIEASGPGDTITVQVERDDGRYRVTVHNPGKVPPQAATHMFEKYNTSEKSQGTGLGVYSARLIARTHGGDITFSSVAGEGTRFTVILPAD